MLLAPVIRERKGEHVQVFDQLRAQGFVRARVDGTVYDLDAVPPLTLAPEAHDRSGDRPLPPARRHQAAPGGIVRNRVAARRWTRDLGRYGRREGAPNSCCRRAIRARSAITRCPNSSRVCSRSTRPWARVRPAMAWASRRCSMPARVVGHPELSLAGGAVRGWDRRNAYYFQLILSLGAHYGSTSIRRGRNCPKRGAEGHPVRQRRGQDRVPLHHRARRPRHARARIRRHPAEPGAALQGNRIAGRARGTGQVHQRSALPRLPRSTPQPQRAQRLRRPITPCRRSRALLDRSVTGTSSKA